MQQSHGLFVIAKLLVCFHTDFCTAKSAWLDVGLALNLPLLNRIEYDTESNRFLLWRIAYHY